VNAAQQLNGVAVDISSGMAEVQAAFDPVLRTVGDVHTIVNSAGISEAR
jgi:NAD(P)-dependent dehydrogenase (short-subunit alcohol dehydrogenase family)